MGRQELQLPYKTLKGCDEAKVSIVSTLAWFATVRCLRFTSVRCLALDSKSP